MKAVAQHPAVVLPLVVVPVASSEEAPTLEDEEHQLLVVPSARTKTSLALRGLESRQNCKVETHLSNLRGEDSPEDGKGR